VLELAGSLATVRQCPAGLRQRPEAEEVCDRTFGDGLLDAGALARGQRWRWRLPGVPEALQPAPGLQRGGTHHNSLSFSDGGSKPEQQQLELAGG